MLRKKLNYRHYVCVLITLLFLASSIFLFPFAFARLCESVWDICFSTAHFFVRGFSLNFNIPPFVNRLSRFFTAVPFGLPSTWEEFKRLVSTYFNTLFSGQNIGNYISFWGNLFYWLTPFLLFFVVFILISWLMCRKYFKNHNNDYNKDSRALARLKAFFCVCEKIKLWVGSFFSFVKQHKFYWIVWVLIWAYNFNLFSIAIEFVAFYIYFAISFDFANIYVQFYKLLCDLTPMLEFIPFVVWLILGFFLFHRFRTKIGDKSVRHKELRNRGVINSRGLVLMAVASVGKKKTTFISDVAVSQDIMLRDKAFELILKNDMKFPFFPWVNLENVMRFAMSRHICYNLASTKKFIRHLKYCAFAIEVYPQHEKAIRRHLRRSCGFGFDNLLFDYDSERYGLTYNDELKVVDVWEVIETYAQLYFIYVIESSYVQGNYSVRTDNILSDLGNFPMWDTDVFNRDARYMDVYSRHAHILDFDMLRLGKKVIAQNKNANAFEFGVIVITEIGKERGNALELQDKKKKGEGTNQKNDLFNYWMKMMRHSATVDNYPFVRVVTDDQRPQSWGADARDLCDVIHIKDSGDIKLAMPFFFFEELLYDWVFGKFAKLYYKHRYVRADNTVFMYLLKFFTSKIYNYYTRIYNRYGYCKLSLELESGTLDGELSSASYFLMNKKIYSKRFSTDCFSDFFMQKALRSDIGLADIPEYKTEKASVEELESQNAYFVQDMLLGLKNDSEV